MTVDDRLDNQEKPGPSVGNRILMRAGGYSALAGRPEQASWPIPGPGAQHDQR
ncbi:hypothetical protein PtB15_17B38 [Puccinia triticina]|nr:hypothetical protein PtB15_17B38 [Puccinia triticina]